VNEITALASRVVVALVLHPGLVAVHSRADRTEVDRVAIKN
jgi:hypothetical protein